MDTSVKTAENQEAATAGKGRLARFLNLLVQGSRVLVRTGG